MKRLLRSVACRRLVVVFVLWMILWLNISSGDFKSQVVDTWTYIRGTYAAADIACYDEIIDGSIQEISEDDTKDLNGKAIFFHETSCFSNTTKSYLTAREACAVESAALAHPEHTVFLLYAAPVRWLDHTTNEYEIYEELLSYKNVRVRKVNLAHYTKGTPLEEWYKTDPLQKSSYVISHTSDVLRYLSLWKYGGLYMDLDVVVLKNTDGLGSNYAGAESKMDVAAGILKFDPDENGHRMAEACLRDLRSHFNGNSWGGNGPGVITRVLTRSCGTKFARLMNRTRCKGFMVYSPEHFYPIEYKKWQWYMTEKHLNETLKVIKNSYAIHVWNKFSYKLKLEKSSKAAYTVIAEKYCPKVFNRLKGTF